MILGRFLASFRIELVARGTKHMIRGLQILVPFQPTQTLYSSNRWKQKGWRLSYSPMAKDLINHAYVMEPPQKLTNNGVWRDLVGKHIMVPWRVAQIGKAWKLYAPYL